MFIYVGVIPHFFTRIITPLPHLYIYGYCTIMMFTFFSNNFLSFSFNSPVACSKGFVWVENKNELRGPYFNLLSIPEQ